MIDGSYLTNVPVAKINTLHNSKEHNLSDLSYNASSQYESNNLILNSNLENLNIIK